MVVELRIAKLGDGILLGLLQVARREQLVRARVDLGQNELGVYCLDRFAELFGAGGDLDRLQAVYLELENAAS